MGHTHTNTMEYYSATEKNEIMPPAATWTDTEMATLSQSKINTICYHSNLKYDTNEPIYETDSQT